MVSFAWQTFSEETGFKFSERLQIFDARRKRFGIVVKSSERFHTQFKVKEMFKLLIAVKGNKIPRFW